MRLEDISQVHKLERGGASLQGALMPWKIVEIAKRKGAFRVSWRYRDDRLNARCLKLCKQGWLKSRRCAPGENLYVLGPMAEFERMLS